MVEEKVEVLVRAIIQNKGKVLVCRKTGKDYYFFPGGHLEFRESTKKALIRELKEELGITIKKCSFIGGSEHLFIEDRIKHHEINLTFQVPIRKIDFQSQENHLQFFLLDKDQLSKERVLPEVLTKAVLKWFKNRKPFWVSSMRVLNN